MRKFVVHFEPIPATNFVVLAANTEQAAAAAQMIYRPVAKVGLVEEHSGKDEEKV